MNQCLKRFPLVSFPRCYASTAAARSRNSPDADSIAKSSATKVKKRTAKKGTLLKPPPVPGKNKLQEHLDKLAETNGKLVLADIERCRPPSHTAAGTLVYETEYNNLFKKLSDSFTNKQLRHFAKLYGMSLLSTRTKQEIVDAILKEWDWPSLTTRREKQREAEQGVES